MANVAVLNWLCMQDVQGDRKAWPTWPAEEKQMKAGRACRERERQWSFTIKCVIHDVAVDEEELDMPLLRRI